MERGSFTELEIKAWNKIKYAESVIITSHIHPDGDAIGSCIALAKYCEDMGKEVRVIIDDDIPVIFGFLEGADKVRQPSVYEDGADVLVIVDTNPLRIGNVAKVCANVSISIDHHGTNPHLCDYHIIDADSSSTAEVLWRLLKYEGYDLCAEVANALYVGILTDTVMFRSSSVTANTFHIAAELLEAGANPSMISEALERKDYQELILTAKALSATKLYLNGKVAGVGLDETFDELVLTDAVIDSIRYIDGIVIAFLIKQEKDGGYRVRIRSSVTDVSRIARACGGGGHVDAAGFTIHEKNLADATKTIIGEFQKWLE